MPWLKRKAEDELPIPHKRLHVLENSMARMTFAQAVPAHPSFNRQNAENDIAPDDLMEVVGMKDPSFYAVPVPVAKGYPILQSEDVRMARQTCYEIEKDRKFLLCSCQLYTSSCHWFRCCGDRLGK